VERIDSLIGVLRSHLAELPVSGKINLIVVSDHGMAAISKERYLNLQDIVPERMVKRVTGSSPVFLLEPAQGKKDSILTLINSVKGLKAWSKDKLPGHLHYGTNPRIPEIVVIADSSWMVDIHPVPSVIKWGVHGYDNSNTDMHTIFYAAGPAFKRNYEFPQLYNVDIYNLICRLLNIEPAPNDGDPSVIEKLLR
jgi:predicted AlkP superfamily pyrophosphatase or phosphodiesterase